MRVLISGFLIASAASAAAEETISFNRDIRPILSDKCFFCHGPDEHERKADLRLDDEAIAKKLAIVPGKPDESELIFRLTDEEDPMPPEKTGKQLTKSEIALLRRWVEAGAPYEKYWAYEAPKNHETPEVKNGEWSENWIDRFLMARWEAEGLEPSPDADWVTLARRLYFDLTGLPPTPEQVDLFNAESYEATVDALLASERFAERLASYWLDLVRYADTVGYHGDQDHSASFYRDYVIHALDENTPFDQFTREQLAGDLLPDATLMQRIASGYNRILQTSHEGGVQEKEYLAIYAADHVRNASLVWMGATVGCAQCHDHKYDPYTAKDFYSLAAFFADVDENAHLNDERRKGLPFNSLPTPRPPELEIPSEDQSEKLAELKEKVANSEGEEKKAAEKQLTEFRKTIPRAMITASVEPREMRVLPRGNWLDDSGEIVEPAVPSFLGEIQIENGERATRLDLANWLTDAENGSGGLTARVFANRLWYLFYGVGLSSSLDDFGGQGEAPVHPELLDRLAIDFYENGWDVKRFIKQLVMTRAYRQSSLTSPELFERDPENRLYARQSRYRLPAEMIRDNALAVSGLLVLKRDGAVAKPYQPAGYYKHLNFPQRKYVQHTDDRQWRRAVYMHWQRQFLHPMLRAFDAPSREECTAERPRSNTPLAALTLLNDPTFVEAARVFAERILKEGGDDEASRLDFAWRQAVSRLPSDEERKVSLQLLSEMRKEGGIPKSGLTKRDGSLNPNEMAAWSMLGRLLLNLNETNARN